jgi:LPXTG-site transpeptidase (sortase) family protein
VTRRRVLSGIAAVAFLAAAALAFLFLAGGAEKPAPAGETGATAAAEEPAQPAQPAEAAILRLVIPRIGVNAPVVTLGIDARGEMQSPDSPMDVAWYSFSTLPGRPGNVVMAAHVDYVNYGPAVFWRLRELQPGDEIELALADGGSARYAVSAVTLYDEASAPIAEIVGRKDADVVTLITCSGVFNRQTRLYDKRLVVRGVRAEPSAQAP